MNMLYIAVLSYVKPLSEVDALLPAHVEWLRKGYDDGIFILSGRRNPRTGGVILARGSSIEEIQARMKEDPLQHQGLATLEITPFEPTMSAEDLQHLL
ncbi:YciI family protein [Ewingella americana]|jgi:uncharacterized protein YciI|uniref:YCII-related domain-containing protein n=1 Tax=Ewingella americana TaxID=41202 RepID=A0A502GTI2_9GAMM|nr:YciI family protein [Ewingella americana]TPG64772.1 hypothetical protein EAH77_00525 [Ewingella americana]